MHLRRLWLTDIRCHASIELVFDDATTAILGDNGCGKTTVLEAVGWLATLRSFRGVPDRALVRSGCELGVIRAEIEQWAEGPGGTQTSRTILIEAEVRAAGKKRVFIDRQPLRRSRELLGALRVTVFTPDDLELVKGGPGSRRGYLDELLVAAGPRYDTVCREYDRVLRHRNALLRSGMRGPDDRGTLDIWDDQLVRVGAALVSGRRKLLERLAGPLQEAYANLGGENFEVAGRYQFSWDVDTDEVIEPLVGERATEQALAEVFREALLRKRKQEIDRGTTLVGPHRDDWRITIDGLDARFHASQGEQRSLALALRLAGHQVITDIVDAQPILLLDDVFSELDPSRASALARELPSGQTLLTSAGQIPDSFRSATPLKMGPPEATA